MPKRACVEWRLRESGRLACVTARGARQPLREPIEAHEQRVEYHFDVWLWCWEREGRRTRGGEGREGGEGSGLHLAERAKPKFD